MRCACAGLRKLYSTPPFKGFRKDNAQHAAKIIKWIQEGQSLLASSSHVPSEFLFLDVPALNENRADHFTAILHAMREKCEWLLQSKPGAHRNSGFQQERAAAIARGLMEKHGLPLAYSSPTSAYRTTARLFLEGMTGQTSPGGEDIERACQVVAKRPKDAPALEILAQM